jgi:hypothetical protein
MQHLAMCQKIRKYAWPMCVNSKLTQSYLQFNSTYPETFAEIESAGLQVNDTFRMPELVNNDRVYSQYNYYTMTGRPSNAYRGFNFAAMNKEDGTRTAFCSRFENGALVEMDFDSYHVRLIARLIGYDLPTSSIHDYLGRFYFGVTELTEEQRAIQKVARDFVAKEVKPHIAAWYESSDIPVRELALKLGAIGMLIFRQPLC